MIIDDFERFCTSWKTNVSRIAHQHSGSDLIGRPLIAIEQVPGYGPIGFLIDREVVVGEFRMQPATTCRNFNDLFSTKFGEVDVHGVIGSCEKAVERLGRKSFCTIVIKQETD